MTDAVKSYWDNQAASFGQSDLATAPDHFYRNLEIREILRHLRYNENVLDVGCGNGYSTKIFRDKTTSTFVGIDYSEKMIEQAKKLEGERLSFVCGDVRNLFYSVGGKTFDTIISERCLINLTDWEEQKAAMLEMKKCLATNGQIIFVENFEDGLTQLNDMRATFGLHPIKVRWHNRYLKLAEFAPFIDQHFNVLHKENIGNLYYIISRVVYATTVLGTGMEPEYDNVLNEIASNLPTLGKYNYSPNFLYVLEAK
jgi:SAM-dependent methyltransferase